MSRRKDSVQISPKGTATPPADSKLGMPNAAPSTSLPVAQADGGGNSSFHESSARSNTSSDGYAANSNVSTKSNDSQGLAALDFAKREVSSNLTRHSYSQLSSIANSPDRIPVPAEITTDEPVLATDDQERIRNPVSAAFRRSDVGEEIGYRQPFGEDAEKKNASSSPASSSHTVQSSINNSPLGSTNRWGSTDLMLGAPPSVRRTKRYEPARVVLHKSDSGIGVTQNGGGEGYFNSSTYTPGTEANGSSSSAATMTPTLHNSGSNSSIGSEQQVVSPSLVSSLSSSPTGRPEAGAPLKHIREPKHPLYVPAVLRPTDFRNYRNSIDQELPLALVSSSRRRKLTTQHWTRDASAETCAKCHLQFTWYRRRHHCRKCGGIFCARDSNHVIGLDRDLNFSILGLPCRACDACAADFTVFCLKAPRLQDVNTSTQQPLPVAEPEEIEVGGGGDWSTF